MLAASTKRNDRTPPATLTRQRLETGLLIAVLVLAAALRMGWPGVTEFKADEARLTLLAAEMAEGSHFTSRGISSSVGFPNFPMSVWLYALPLFLWTHVYAATLFTGLLNTVAVFACYWFVRRYWGAEAALAAALMFAVSPWAIHHSRKIWAQNLLPFFVLGWGISAALTFVEKRRAFILLHLLCLAIAIQVHFAAVALAPATLIWLFLFRRRVHWRLVPVGLGLAALTALPFVFYVARQDASVNIMLQRAAAAGGGWNLNAWLYAWMLSSGGNIHALVGAEAFRIYRATVPDLTLAHLAWTLVIGGGLVFLGGRLWSKRRAPAQQQRAEVELLVLTWFLAPILFFSWPRLPVELHYLLPIYPTPYVAAGVLLAALARQWRTPAWVVLGLTAVAQVWIWANLLMFIRVQATPGGFGVPLAMQLEATGLARHMVAETGAAEVLIAGAGESPETEAFAAVYGTLLRDVPHRFVDVSHSAVFPSAAAVAFLDPGAGGRLYEAAATRRETVALRQGEGALAVLALPASASPLPEHTFATPQILTNWVSFIGYDMPRVDEEGVATWHVYWNVGEPAPVDYHIFNHLIDASGQRVAQVDTAVFAASQWRQGDVVVSQFEIPWPDDAAEPLTARTGMYTYPALEPVLVFDVAGNPYSDAIEIPLP